MLSDDPSRPTTHLPFFGACDSALAAADLAALLDFELLRTFEAADAALEPVWRVFFAILITPFPVGDECANSGSAEDHVAGPTTLLEVVAKLTLDLRNSVPRHGAARDSGTSGAIARGLPCRTTELGRHAAGDRIAELVLAIAADQLDTTAMGLGFRHWNSSYQRPDP